MSNRIILLLAGVVLQIGCGTQGTEQARGPEQGDPPAAEARHDQQWSDVEQEKKATSPEPAEVDAEPVDRAEAEAVDTAAEQDLSKWIAQLEDSDPQMRRHACRSLADIGKRAGAAVPDLIRRAEDPDPGIRLTAAWALAQVSEDPAAGVEILCDAKDGPDRELRKSAMYLLEDLGPLAVSAVPRLLGWVAKEYSERGREPYREIVEEMGPAAAPGLTEGLRSTEWHVLMFAAECLRPLGPDAKGAAPLLEEATKHEYPQVRGAAYHALGAIGPENLQTLIVGLDDKSDIARKGACLGLKMLGSQAEAAIPEIIRTAPMKREDFSPQDGSALALAAIGPAVVPALCKELADKESESHIVALQTLALLDPPPSKALPAVSKIYAEEKRPIPRRMCRKIMVAAGPEAIPFVAELLESDDHRVRTDAVRLLGEFNDPAAFPALQTALEDQNEWVRAEALEGVSEYFDKADLVIPKAIDMLQNDDSETVKRSALLCLGKYGPKAKDAIPVLEKLSQEGSRGARAALVKIRGQ